MYEYTPMFARITYQERLPRAKRGMRMHEADRGKAWSLTMSTA